MRNILLALLLANILYYMWARYNDPEVEQGVMTIDEADLGPPLDMTPTPAPDVASIGAVLGSGEPSALQAVTGRTCVSVGPFNERARLDAAVRKYTGDGYQAKLRASLGQIFVGHWVQIRNVPDEQEAKVMLRELSEGGVNDAYLVRTDDEGLKLSLGVFGDLERAERVELQAESLEFVADISSRYRDGAVFFVDIELPPGKGAVDIVEEYGQELVLMRDEATCP